MTVYELIQQLTEFPADMEISTSVIGEHVEPVNVYQDDVDIDVFNEHGIVNVIKCNSGEKEFCKLEIELTTRSSIQELYNNAIEILRRRRNAR